MFFNLLTSVFLLYFFIFLLMCCAICRSAFAQDNSEVQQEPLSLFDPGTKLKKSGNSGQDENFESFTSPSLNYVDGLLVVFAQATNNNDEKRCDIVEGHFNLKKNSDQLVKVFDKSDGVWNKGIVFKNNAGFCAKGPTAVVDKTKIYSFFKNSSCTESNNDLQYGAIVSKTVNNANNEITWGDFINLKENIKPDGNDLKIADFVASGGPGILVNENLVVPLWYKKNSKDFVSIITNTSDTSKNEWKLVVSSPLLEGTYPAIFEGESNKLIMMILSKEGTRKVYESINMGEEWKEAVGSISGVWGNTQKRTPSEHGSQGGFITADVITGKPKVILVTQGVETTNKYNLHLWMTDYKRVYDVGAIATEIEKNPSSTLLYAENNLFVAYEMWKTQKSTINIKHLKDELNKIKEVYELWTAQDGKLSNSCFADDLTIKEELCTNNNKIPTVGLVGFLSGNYSGNKWGDEYWCVNATVTRGTNVANGLKFSGAGAGAMWPVSEQGQNEPYHFANNEFTLMATVKIDGDANDNKNSILGMGFEESDAKNSIGLWCSNGKWSVTDKKNTKEKTQSIEKTCVKEGIYHVALILNHNTLFVHIGNQKNGKLPESSIVLKKPLKITHFYFGADTTATSSQAAVESHVTVTNVLLYNRPLPTNEIEKLKEYVKPVEATTNPNENVITDTTGGDQHPPPLPPQDPIGREQKDEKAPSPSRPGDGGVGGGVRVFSLLLAVLCVSAPLLHL